MSSVLAIDPGNEFSAIAGWNGKGAFNYGKLANHEALACLEKTLCLHDLVAIEMIGHYGSGLAVGKTVFDTCIWIGRFIQFIDCRHVRWGSRPKIELIKRATVKAHICGAAKAKDGNVRQALIDRIGEPGTAKKQGPTYGFSKDAWQALALAVYAHDIYFKKEQ